MTKEQLIAWATSRIRRAQESLAAFAKKVLEDPEKTAEWDLGLYKETADLVVAEHVLHLAEGDCSLTVVIENLQDYLIDGAVRLNSSTNPGARLLSEQKVRAYSEALRTFRDRLKYAQEAEAKAAPASAA